MIRTVVSLTVYTLDKFLVLLKFYLLSDDGTSCASVANDIQGSFKLKSAHDFDLKLIPWKQAREMLMPCNSIVPPRTVPFPGKGKDKVDNWRPATWFKTFCQWRWWRASANAEVVAEKTLNSNCNCYMFPIKIFFYSVFQVFFSFCCCWITYLGNYDHIV